MPGREHCDRHGGGRGIGRARHSRSALAQPIRGPTIAPFRMRMHAARLWSPPQGTRAKAKSAIRPPPGRPEGDEREHDRRSPRLCEPRCKAGSRSAGWRRQRDRQSHDPPWRRVRLCGWDKRCRAVRLGRRRPLFSKHPTWNGTNVSDCLLLSATPARKSSDQPIPNDDCGYGILDAGRALKACDLRSAAESCSLTTRAT